VKAALLGRHSERRELAAIGTVDQAGSTALVGRALEAGVNFFDTADVYSEGQSEIQLGQALRDLGVKREDVIIATKVRGRMGPGPNAVGLSRGHIMDQIAASLKRLGLEHVDLYQIHGFDPVTPLEETLRALDDCVSRGLVRRFLETANLTPSRARSGSLDRFAISDNLRFRSAAARSNACQEAMDEFNRHPVVHTCRSLSSRAWGCAAGPSGSTSATTTPVSPAPSTSAADASVMPYLAIASFGEEPCESASACACLSSGQAPSVALTVCGEPLRMIVSSASFFGPSAAIFRAQSSRSATDDPATRSGDGRGFPRPPESPRWS
jgi:hypothetical protein